MQCSHFQYGFLTNLHYIIFLSFAINLSQFFYPGDNYIQFFHKPQRLGDNYRLDIVRMCKKILGVVHSSAQKPWLCASLSFRFSCCRPRSLSLRRTLSFFYWTMPASRLQSTATRTSRRQTWTRSRSAVSSSHAPTRPSAVVLRAAPPY